MAATLRLFGLEITKTGQKLVVIMGARDDTLSHVASDLLARRASPQGTQPQGQR